MRWLGGLALLAACGGGSETPDALASCTPSPAFDPSFGMQGIAAAPDGVPYTLPADAVALDDGRFVVVGRSAFAPHDFVLARYLPDGSFDTTFGVAGIAEHALGAMGTNGAEPTSIALAPEGKLAVAGWVDGPAIARFNADGSLDTTFPQGYIRVPTAEHVASNTAGMILAGIDPNGMPSELVVMRVKHDGNFDAAFTIVREDVGAGSPIRVEELALAPDGRILVAGRVASTGQAFLRRYSAQGVRDTAFPVVQLPPSIGIGAIDVRPDGRIFLALSRIESEPMPGTYVGVAALSETGALDSSFGDAGYAWSRRVTDTGATDLVVASNAEITVTGSHYGGPQLMAARFTPAGAADPCFGDQGLGYIGAGESPAAVIDTNDRITLAGFGYADPINTRLVVARVAP